MAAQDYLGLRLISGRKPRPFFEGEHDEYPLDAIEIVPIFSTPQDDACFIVRYDNLATGQVEGDHVYLTLQDALTAAEEDFDITPEDWTLPPGFDSVEGLYQAMLAQRIALYG